MLVSHVRGSVAFIAVLAAACSDDGSSSTGQPDARIGLDAGPRPDVGDRDAGPADTAPDAGDLIPGRVECDPLMPSYCALPWPSNMYLNPNAGGPNMLSFLPGALPANREDVIIDENRFVIHNGYSPETPIIVLFPDLDISSMATEVDLGPSMAANAPIQLFKFDGIFASRVPYYVDQDELEPDPMERLTFVRPAEVLEAGARYIVAFRDLVDRSGNAYEPSFAFTLLANRQTTGTRLEERQRRFDDLFSILEQEGVFREELVLAWDFNVADGERLSFRVERLRESYDRVVSENGINYTITSTVISDDPEILARFEGEFQAPWFLRPEQINGRMGEVLNAPDSSNPEPVGVRAVPFSILAPRESEFQRQDPPPSLLVQVGHPYLSGRRVIEDPEYVTMANDRRWILIATDWLGFSQEDGDDIEAASEDVNQLQFVVDRRLQALVNQWMLSEVIIDFFDRSALRGFMNHVPGRVFFYGFDASVSVAPALLGTSQRLERGALVAGSFDLATAGTRSERVSDLLRGPAPSLITAYGTSVEAWLALASAQMLLDYTASSLFFGRLAGGHGPFSPTRVLLTGVKGDRQSPVPPLERIVRTSTLGVVLLENFPEGRVVDGVTPAAYPYEGSGWVMFDVGADFPTPGGRPPPAEGPDPHDALQSIPEHQDLVRRFFDEGRIEDVCGDQPCRFDD